MEQKKLSAHKTKMILIVVIGVALIAAILYASNVWTVRSVRRNTKEAVHNVSDFYLRELTGRREQVVISEIRAMVKNAVIATEQMEEQDLSDLFHLMMFESRIARLYELESFSFVDADGLVYTSFGIRENISKYSFDYRSLREPDVSVRELGSKHAMVVIAVPIEPLSFYDTHFTVCILEISLKTMLEGLSLQTDSNGFTVCNLYCEDGASLSDVVLGGLSSEHNLLTALGEAEFLPGFSLARVTEDFAAGREGIAAFSFHGVRQTMYYMPVEGTDWLLTYLIQDSIISDQINSISQAIIRRSMMQTVVIAILILGVFAVILRMNRRTARLALEKETAHAKQQELENRLTLQNQLLEQERRKRQADAMITAMASDYRSVYYIDLDRDEGVCYRADAESGIQAGESFPFAGTCAAYAEKYVVEADRANFLQFVSPEAIRERLKTEKKLIAHRYVVQRDGAEHYEMLRIADVRPPEERDGEAIHAVGLGLSDVDAETREAMMQRRALSDALAQAKEANAAKTSFLSSMSHEIRTPMNAIIGLDSIALKEPNLPARTRELLEKINASAKHLLSLINDILDMSRIESGRMTLKHEEFSFSEMLEQINTMIHGQCQDKGLHYDCQILGRADDYYIGDDMKIKQVIINILGNAVKFTPPGGKVSFRVEPLEQFEGNAPLRFVIQDTGIGMDKAYIPKIFDAFSQENENKANKYGSTGLGMEITRNIVEMMNGSITVESEKGVGSTFTVTITLRTSSKKGTADMAEDIRPQDLRVLVIDDDSVAREHTRLVLEDVGISSDSCSSGAEAYDLLWLAQARTEPYNLILVDLKMPEEDGVAVTRKIRKIYDAETTIIILTAYSWDDIMEDALEAGVDSFMAKPLFASNVIHAFQRSIRLKQRTPAKKADLTGRHILLAEDMPINAEIMIEVLGMREMTVDHAENGEIAVKLFAESAAGAYDAILMDVRMPALNGLEAAKAIRAMNRPDAKTVPIIALTANAFDEDVQRSLQVGMNAHLSKPVDPELLFETLERFIPA